MVEPCGSRVNPMPPVIRANRKNLAASLPVVWKRLDIDKSELNLPLTFPTGQTFRWKRTGHLQYTGPVGPHLVSLRQLEDGTVGYHLHFSEDEDEARIDLLDFLNVHISLKELWGEFGRADPRFAELAENLEGARVLRQEPLGCLIQFICSSNNNIGRITGMVDFISSKGRVLGTVGGYDFFEFPDLETLARVSEGELRGAGFGYRAKYIVGAVEALALKPGGGVEWLTSLRKSELGGAIDGLRSIAGVGPKVAACVALFSLDKHDSVPVDTHVWRIARRHLLLPELTSAAAAAAARLTPRMHSYVGEAFVRKYGKYAGWAQTLLFISQLPSQKPMLPPLTTELELPKEVLQLQKSGNKRKKKVS
ncbi:hypothetical protein M569_12448 [Genlisea aurea]|uniref:DNA-(apurinic or apyrimidinic site) lyase n=1 Tax=Genlisea aurea TaxID=192259 RepID=S8DI09_9LAMI|nr:hypothetical protein M569_12448 [Genlisea aurea]